LTGGGDAGAAAAGDAADVAALLVVSGVLVRRSALMVRGMIGASRTCGGRGERHRRR